MRNLYHQINQHLKGQSKQRPEGNALKRINTLSGLISGIIRKGCSHLPALGSGIPKDIDSNSKTTEAKRFVESKWIDYEAFFCPIYFFSYKVF